MYDNSVHWCSIIVYKLVYSYVHFDYFRSADIAWMYEAIASLHLCTIIVYNSVHK